MMDEETQQRLIEDRAALLQLLVLCQQVTVTLTTFATDLVTYGAVPLQAETQDTLVDALQLWDGVPEALAATEQRLRGLTATVEETTAETTTVGE
jgi:hypothetical protein